MPVLANFGRVDGKCRTENKNKIYSYSWSIKNFRKLYNNVGGWHESPVLSMGHGCEWKLNVYVAGYDETTKGFVGIEANLTKKVTQHNLKLLVECSIMTEDGDKYKVTETILADNSLDKYAVTFKNFISRRTLMDSSELLPDGFLHISFRVIVDKSNTDEKLPTTVEARHYQKNSMEIFERFFNNEKFSDFVFVVQLKQFHVHRMILAAHSPVFEAMFDSKMRESKEGQVYIDDIEPQVMEKLLRYIYVGETDVKALADKILVAADKYQLDDLKVLCENSLSQNLNLDNVYDILQLADKYSADELKKKTMDFINNNMKALSAKKNFQESIASLPVALQTQIICTFAKKL